MLPTIKEETFKRICPQGVFCDADKSRKFLCDSMVWLEDESPRLYCFLMDILTGQKGDFDLKKNVGFDAVLACVSICKLIAAEAKLPIISDQVYNKTIAEFTTNPSTFCLEMDNKTIDKFITMVIVVCSGNYKMLEYEREYLYIKTTAFMIYKMLEKASNQ